ncbi:ring-finger-containing ubiquitin ligase [Stylonychia lemnae]|uniref:RING-type E3 ubiquitin transferase n=1 Tax=Stylonychia lemnae TaxID=5949 RepID=A0A078A559_STYLE|nr:ring-finger-containing ubiquitin ligase [Stylonychia lemnae]|eukprot:CDW77339.1 ring-finger-containing ubiquitin ligase [Stylonychia lemnae]
MMSKKLSTLNQDISSRLFSSKFYPENINIHRMLNDEDFDYGDKEQQPIVKLNGQNSSESQKNQTDIIDKNDFHAQNDKNTSAQNGTFDKLVPTSELSMHAFAVALERFRNYSGFYDGNWNIDQIENPTLIFNGLEQRQGKSRFKLEFISNNEEVFKKGHAHVIGAIFYGDFRNKEAIIEFNLTAYNDFNIDTQQGSIRMQNVQTRIKRRDDMMLTADQLEANFDHYDPVTNPLSGQIGDEELHEQNKLRKIILNLDLSEKSIQSCFVHKIHFELQQKSIEELVEKVSNYSFMITAVCMMLVYSILGQIKRAMEYHQVAETLSIPMLSFSIIWNFIYFSIHFELAFQQDVYLKYGLVLLILNLVTDKFEKKTDIFLHEILQLFIALTTSLDFFIIVFYMAKYYILMTNYAIILLNSTLWVPQIIRSYRLRSKFGPESYFVNTLTLSHNFLIFYMRGCPYNIFDKQTNYVFLLIVASFLALQVYIVKYQQLRHPRFFVPIEWRRNPNAYNYYFKFSNKNSQINQDIETQEINQVEECVICMNPLRYQVNQVNDQMITVNDPEQTMKKAKNYMKTPCNHKFHEPCLKKWMVIRLECPCCRQVIPAIEDD